MSSIRRGDFTEQAEAYGRARPSYPAAVVDALLDDAEVRAGDAVLELGAGTGLFTRALSERGLRVTASEPNAAMRAQAPELEHAAFVDGSFEAPGVADGSQAWAVAAQAFHWATPERALPAIRRTLDEGRSTRAFSVLWNIRDVERSEVLTWTLARIERIAAGFDEGYKFVDWADVLTSTGDFEAPRTRIVKHAVRMSAERFLDLWRSHNHLNATAAPADVARLLEDIAAYLREREIDELDVPYSCKSVTVTAS